MISTRKSAKFVALLAGSALVLSACATSDDDGASGDATVGGGGDAATTEPTETEASPGDGAAGEGGEGGTFTYAYEQEIFSYNSDTADTNASANAVALNPVLRGFWYFGPEGTVEPDEEFGTYEVTSEDPLTIDYTFAEGAVWSDGEPIDCDDAVLYWASQSGNFPGFSQAGTTGYEDHDRPDCEDGDTEFTVTYNTPYADWAATYGSLKPAHVLERESGVEDIIAAVDAGDEAALEPAAEFWNTGWNFAPGEWNADTALSSGPYVVDSWEAGQSITYVANDQWWGTPPASDTIVTRFIGQDAQAQALQNGEVQAMDPQPSPDLLAQLEAIGDSVTVEGADQYTYEHWDFNFQSEFENPVLREAFAKCLPRQTIIDNLIAPLNPDAEVLNSRFVFPFEPDYERVASEIYDGEAAEQDIEAAAALLEENGLTGQTLRLGHNANPRRTQQAALIVDACGPNGAGFDVQDIGNENFFEADGELATGAFDVAMFAWAGSPLKSGSVSTFQCVAEGADKGNNNGFYCNEEVDELLQQLTQEPDADAQTDLVIQIETLIWEDLGTIPGFAFPGVVATTANAEGVVYNPTQAGLTWNAYEWRNTAQ